MPEFTEVYETIRAEEASMSRLFGGDGTRVRDRRKAPQYMARLTEAAGFIAEIVSGQRPTRQLAEAMTTSDFPLLFGDVLDRQVLANYQEAPVTWPSYIKRGTVRDFRTVRRFAITGGEAVLAKVLEQAPYPEAALGEAKYDYSVAKYGRRMPFSFEALINDDLDALRDVPARFGRAARRSEEKFATELFVSSTGPNATFYATGNLNQVNQTNGASANNPPLSITAMQDALIVLSKMVDSDGEPITVDHVELVVPPALEVIAQNILNATEIWATAAAAGGATGQELHTANWMRSKLHLSVNSYLPIVNTTSGNTAWYMFANPSNGRPAIEMGFLRGYEQPQIFMKSPNATAVGGGAINPMDGDFDTDSIEYKVRHIFGGVLLDPKSSVASNGTGA